MPINVTWRSPRQTGLNVPSKYRRPYNRPSAALGVWETMQRQQQRERENLYDFKYRDALLRQRQAQMEPGEMVDPLEAAQGTRAARRIEAQRRANARARRLGKDIPHQDAEAQFVPGPTAAEQRARGQELADMEWKEDQRRAAEDLRFQRSQAEESIPSIPDHLAGTEWEPKLRKLNEAEMELRTGRDHNPDDPEVQRELKRIQRRREKYMQQAGPPPDPGEKISERARVWDTERGGLRTPETGEEPDYLIDDDGNLIPFPQSEREEAQAKAAEAKKEEEKKKQQVYDSADMQRRKAARTAARSRMQTDDDFEEAHGTKPVEEQLRIATEEMLPLYPIEDYLPKGFVMPGSAALPSPDAAWQPAIGGGGSAAWPGPSPMPAAGAPSLVPPPIVASPDDLKNLPPIGESPTAQQTARKLSPDGKWEWNGQQWVSVGGG
jgi:hypothetical protein